MTQVLSKLKLLVFKRHLALTVMSPGWSRTVITLQFYLWMNKTKWKTQLVSGRLKTFWTFLHLWELSVPAKVNGGVSSLSPKNAKKAVTSDYLYSWKWAFFKHIYIYIAAGKQNLQCLIWIKEYILFSPPLLELKRWNVVNFLIAAFRPGILKLCRLWTPPCTQCTVIQKN